MKASLKSRLEKLGRRAQAGAQGKVVDGSSRRTPEQLLEYFAGVYRSKWIREQSGIVDPLSEAVDEAFERVYGPLDNNSYTLENDSDFQKPREGTCADVDKELEILWEPAHKRYLELCPGLKSILGIGET